MKGIFFQLILGMMMVLSSCTGRMTPDSYSRWMDEQLETFEYMESSKFKARVQYKPNEWVAVREQGVTTLAELNAWTKDWSDWFFLSVNMELKDVLTIDRTGQDVLSRFFSGGAKSCFFLASELDTLSCQYMHYENRAGLSSNRVLLLGFDRRERLGGEDVVLIFKPPWEDRRVIHYSLRDQLACNYPTLIIPE